MSGLRRNPSANLTDIRRFLKSKAKNMYRGTRKKESQWGPSGKTMDRLCKNTTGPFIVIQMFDGRSLAARAPHAAV